MMNELMKEAALDALREVDDPETGLSVVDLGLIYGVTVEGEDQVCVRMTLTSRACPAGEMIRQGVERRLLLVPGVKQVNVDVSFEPPWTPARITPDGRAQLGWPPE